MMIPTESVNGDVLNNLLVCVILLGVMLIVGVLLRLWIPVLQRYFIPAALIGGLLGLAAGPNALGLVPTSIVDTWAAIPGILIALVFAPMLMGERLPKASVAARIAAPHIIYAYVSTFAIVGIPALITYFILGPALGTHQLFSTIFEVSWPGGHGTAAGMGPAYEELGWAAGSSLAVGAATFGLIFGIVAGMIMINIAARRGSLRMHSSGRQNTPQDSEILPARDAESYSWGRLNKASLDNLALHFSLIGLAVLIGMLLKLGVDKIMAGVPLFPLAMIGGLIVQFVLNRTPYADLVDKKTLNSIAGIALDFLVVAAVASISIPVIIENWIALTVATLVVAVISLGIFYILSPRLFREDWFENGIINFGAMTGVVAVGLLLLRAADPDMRTDAARGYALRAPFASPFVGGGLITALFPILADEYGNLWLGIGCLVSCVAVLGIARLLGVWHTPGTRLANGAS